MKPLLLFFLLILVSSCSFSSNKGDEITSTTLQKTGNDECILDPKYLEPILKLPPDLSENYVIEQKKQELLEETTLKSGYVIKANQGGCEHYGIIVSFEYTDEETVKNLEHHWKETLKILSPVISGSEKIKEMADAIKKGFSHKAVDNDEPNITVYSLDCSDKKCAQEFRESKTETSYYFNGTRLEHGKVLVEIELDFAM